MNECVQCSHSPYVKKNYTTLKGPLQEWISTPQHHQYMYTQNPNRKVIRYMNELGNNTEIYIEKRRSWSLTEIIQIISDSPQQ